LHARFVGALYLFGGVYLLACATARYLVQVRPAPLAVVLFTSLLLLVTLLNPEAFDYDLVPPRVWTGSYVVYPLLGLLVIAGMRRRRGAQPAAPSPPSWARQVLVAQAVVFGVAGVALLVSRETMVDLWPWPISAGLAQFYGAPFVAYAWCSWMYSRSRTWTEAATFIPAMLAFTGATVVVSLIHLELFSADDLEDWVWFGVFGVLALASAAMAVQALLTSRDRRQTAVPDPASAHAAAPA
jgi:hypothetical protein